VVIPLPDGRGSAGVFCGGVWGNSIATGGSVVHGTFAIVFLSDAFFRIEPGKRIALWTMSFSAALLRLSTDQHFSQRTAVFSTGHIETIFRTPDYVKAAIRPVSSVHEPYHEIAAQAAMPAEIIASPARQRQPVSGAAMRSPARHGDSLRLAASRWRHGGIVHASQSTEQKTATITINMAVMKCTTIESIRRFPVSRCPSAAVLAEFQAGIFGCWGAGQFRRTRGVRDGDVRGA